MREGRLAEIKAEVNSELYPREAEYALELGKELVAEVERLEGRLQAVCDVLSDAEAFGEDVPAGKVMDAVRGHGEPATAEQERLWKMYFDNKYNERVGAHVPMDRFLEKKNMVLRCNWCAYLVGGWVHVEWHQNQPHWKTEKMLKERREKLGGE